jgi:CHASE2 domain-containing sensor protein
MIPVLFYLCPRSSTATMYKIFFSIGHLLEATFTILEAMGWLPVIGISLILAFGLVYWLMLQRRYSAEAKRRGSLI